jgi:glucose/arabinose dehydrogenase
VVRAATEKDRALNYPFAGVRNHGVEQAFSGSNSVDHKRTTQGRPEGSYQNFLTGFCVSGDDQAKVWGRPASIALTKDGGLLVADDTAGTIWKVTYTGPADAAAKVQ